MKTRSLVFIIIVLLVGLLGASPASRAADNPAFWKYKAKGDFAEVLTHVKHGIEAAQGPVEHHRLRQRDRGAFLFARVQSGGVQHRP